VQTRIYWIMHWDLSALLPIVTANTCRFINL
jgi:hypothetical protein